MMAEKEMKSGNISEQEIATTEGLSFPVRSSTLRRLLVRKASCDDLYPNPEDEFFKPEVGPGGRRNIVSSR